MNESLINSAFLNESNNKDLYEICYQCFCEIKKSIDISFGALFYKNSKKYELKQKISFIKEFKNYIPDLTNKEKDFFRFKTPFIVHGATIGYFLFIKKTYFKNGY